MIQKTIRDWGGVEFTTTEGAEQQTEWNDRTVYAVDGYNSIAELGVGAQAIELKTDFITVTQAVNLDTMESDTATNNAKVTYDDAAQVATNKTNADASKVKTDFITVTGAIDLDSNVPLLDTANTFTNAANKFLGGLFVRDSGNVVNVLQVGNSGSKTQLTSESGEFEFKGQTGGSNSTFNFLDGGVSWLSSNTDGAWVMPVATIGLINGRGDKAIPSVEWVVDSMVNSTTTGEPTGSDKVVNMVSLTQAEYNAFGAPNETTFYVITDA